MDERQVGSVYRAIASDEDLSPMIRSVLYEFLFHASQNGGVVGEPLTVVREYGVGSGNDDEFNCQQITERALTTSYCKECDQGVSLTAS